MKKMSDFVDNRDKANLKLLETQTCENGFYKKYELEFSEICFKTLPPYPSSDRVFHRL